jgi:hypothetical protein
VVSLRKKRKLKKKERRRKTDLDGNPIFFLKGAKKSWDQTRNMKWDGLQQPLGLIGSGSSRSGQGTHKKAILSKLVRLSK